jgi:hypothetical protein
MVKDRRKQPGGEWEPIKIPHQNSIYVPNLIQHDSLLAQPIPHSYKKTIDPQNRVRQLGNTAESPLDASTTTREINDDQNRINW